MAALSLLLPLAVAGGEAAFLTAHSLLRPPAWRERYQGNWARMNFLALLIAVSGAAVTTVAWANLPLLPLTAVAAASASLTFATVQSLHTDPALRLVNRHMLYLAMVLPLLLHGWVLLPQGGPLVTAWVVFMLAAGALVFLPGLMGASDGRALLLVAVAAFPPLGFRLLSWGLGGFLLLAFTYAFATGVREVGLRRPGKLLQAVGAKKSLPAVPMILAPFALLLPLAGFLTL